MNKRKIIVTLIGVAILVVSFLASGMLKRAQPDLRPKPGEIATAVSTLPIAPGEVGRTLKVTGRLVPQSSVDLFAEVGGLAEFGDRPFKPGVRFEKGQVLLRINAAELESNLAASRSGFQSQLAGVIPDLKIDFPDEADAWKTYLEEMRVERTLAPLPDVDSQKLRLFLTGRNIYTTYYNIKEAETRREKHILRAPFSGSVTAASIDDAELVRVGQSLGTFISTGRYELEAGVSYRDVGALEVGKTFALRDVNTGEAYEARVARINDAVDPLTQQVKVYAEVRSNQARSGIYLEGNVVAATFDSAAQIPLRALVDERAIFVVRDSVATLLPVEVRHKSAESAIITGLEGPEQLITSKHNEAFAGSKVNVTQIAE